MEAPWGTGNPILKWSLEWGPGTSMSTFLGRPLLAILSSNLSCSQPVLNLVSQTSNKENEERRWLQWWMSGERPGIAAEEKSRLGQECNRVAQWPCYKVHFYKAQTFMEPEVTTIHLFAYQQLIWSRLLIERQDNKAGKIEDSRKRWRQIWDGLTPLRKP